MCLSSLRIDLVRDAQTAVSIPIPRIIRTYYPGFDIWFDRTVLPSLGKGRAILLARINGELTGFAFSREIRLNGRFAPCMFPRLSEIEGSVPHWSNIHWDCWMNGSLW